MTLILVCGSRTWQHDVLMHEALKRAMTRYDSPITVIHGAAKGADQRSGWIAESLGMSVKAVPADWKRHGKRAGVIRNCEMLDERPDVVLAFWDGESSGTEHTINEAKRRGIPIEVVRSP